MWQYSLTTSWKVPMKLARNSRDSKNNENASAVEGTASIVQDRPPGPQKSPNCCVMMVGHIEDSFWSNYSVLTRPHPKWWFSKGNPLISGNSRLVKYWNLARFLDVSQFWRKKIADVTSSTVVLYLDILDSLALLQLFWAFFEHVAHGPEMMFAFSGHVRWCILTSPKKVTANRPKKLCTSPKTNMDTKNSQTVERKSSSKTSKNFPTDPWSIPQTPNQQFMFRNSCNIWGWKGMLQGYAVPGVWPGVPLANIIFRLHVSFRGCVHFHH